MPTPRPLPPLEVLQEWFSYDPETGLITWVKSPSGHVPVGRTAGATSTTVGYVYIYLNRKPLLAHRVAWMLHHGTDPGEWQIDHIDGNRANNRPCNLRLSTTSENGRNSKTPANNTSGVKGVNWHYPTGKWVAKIQHHRKRYHLGLFNTIEEAAAAMRKAREEMHGDFTNDGRFSHLKESQPA